MPKIYIYIYFYIYLIIKGEILGNHIATGITSRGIKTRFMMKMRDVEVKTQLRTWKTTFRERLAL